MGSYDQPLMGAFCEEQEAQKIGLGTASRRMGLLQ